MKSDIVEGEERVVRSERVRGEDDSQIDPRTAPKQKIKAENYLVDKDMKHPCVLVQENVPPDSIVLDDPLDLRPFTSPFIRSHGDDP